MSVCSGNTNFIVATMISAILKSGTQNYIVVPGQYRECFMWSNSNKKGCRWIKLRWVLNQWMCIQMITNGVNMPSWSCFRQLYWIWWSTLALSNKAKLNFTWAKLKALFIEKFVGYFKRWNSLMWSHDRYLIFTPTT